jgi:CYTH domain-containing protein
MTTTNTSLELELTFLARRLPAELVGVTPMRLVDIYVPDDLSIHPHVRLRQKGDRFELTKKTQILNGDASQHVESTIELTADEFDSLAAGHTRIVEKDRYAVVLGGNAAEVDVFTGGLEGLVLIDFEFDQESKLNAFTPPEVCASDVTQEDFIAGGLLAGRTYHDIELELARHSYTAI